MENSQRFILVVTKQHNLLIRKITRDINKTQPDVALTYLMDEMMMAMALTSVLKLASTKYILRLYSRQ